VSRQMAFQLGQMDILRRFAIIMKSPPAEKSTVGEALRLITTDEKELFKLRAVYSLMVKCLDDPIKTLRCRKMVCWRDPNSVIMPSFTEEKFDLEMEFSPEDPPLWMIREAGILDYLRTLTHDKREEPDRPSGS